jgi:hypothetical protein
MKLYTEEDMKKAFWEGHIYAASIAPASMGWQDRYVQNTIDSFTPIELPSDEDIEEKAEDISNEEIFILGAKWMKEQILNQNK